MTAAEVLQAREVIRSLRLDLRPVLTRRHEPDPRGRFIDLRRTLRTSVRTGGSPAPPPAQVDPHAPSHDRGALRHLRVDGVLFADSAPLLPHPHQRGRPGPHLRLRHPPHEHHTAVARPGRDRALDRIGHTVRDWYGGTRIGASLEAFNLHWSRRLLAQGAVVLLVTDGLDREGGEGIRAQARRLRKSCRSLVWLNPLLRYRGFAPKAAGIRALLPEVDEHRPVHNLDSLVQLAEVLGGRGRGGWGRGGRIRRRERGREVACGRTPLRGVGRAARFGGDAAGARPPLRRSDKRTRRQARARGDGPRGTGGGSGPAPDRAGGYAAFDAATGRLCRAPRGRPPTPGLRLLLSCAWPFTKTIPW